MRGAHVNECSRVRPAVQSEKEISMKERFTLTIVRSTHLPVTYAFITKEELRKRIESFLKDDYQISFYAVRMENSDG